MENSQMASLYREAYARAYRRMRISTMHKRLRNLSILVTLVILLAVTTITKTGRFSETVSDGGQTRLKIDKLAISSRELQDGISPNASEECVPEYICREMTFTMGSRSPVKTEEATDLTNAESEMTEGVSSREILTEEQLEFVERVVEAEVTGTVYKWNGEHVDDDEMLKSKIRVVQVFLNRAEDTERFSKVTSLYEAISYPGASSTVRSGRYLDVEVTDLTREAVQIALDPNTEDLTDGALFFLSDGAKECKYGDYIFTDAVGHSFFK